MNRRPVPGRFGALVLLLCLFFASVPAMAAGQVVGQITAIDVGRGVVEIDGETHLVATAVRVSASARGTGTGIRHLQDLKPGQVVRYETTDGRITTITVMPGLTEVPL